MAKKKRDEVEAVLSRAPRKELSPKDYLSLGVTTLNLAACGRPTGGIPKGAYVFIVGDTNTGKTWIIHTVFAEAAKNPNFDGYDFYFDNAEKGAKFDVATYFGRKTADRIQPPPRDDSVTVDDWFFNLDDCFKRKRPFIYAVDSIDALEGSGDQKSLETDKKLTDEGKPLAGSYGVNRAKTMSGRMRVLSNRLAESGSMLFAVGQSRDYIPKNPWEAKFSAGKKTRAGGNAIGFYNRLEIWTSRCGKLIKAIKGVKRQVGIVTRFEFKKNHFSGWEGKVEVPILYRYGLDDVGASVHFLVEEGHWKAEGAEDPMLQKITAPEFEVSKATRESLIEEIEDMNDEDKLRNLVARVWAEIEEAKTAKRKTRYE